jgi:hypothetical protein
MATITLDPAKRLDIKYHQGSDGSKTLTFVDSAGDAYTITGNTYVLNIKRKIGDDSNVLQLTEGSGLTKNTSSLVITLTDTQTTALNGDYYWELVRTDGSGLVKRWLNGYLQETKIFDGLTETTGITIDESGTAVTVTISEPTSLDATSSALVDGATIDLTGSKHTLATALGRTFTVSFTGDFIEIDITLSATSATFTFPAGYLCSFAGTASGDNTLVITGATSGDLISVAIKKNGSQYLVAAANFGQ